MTRDHPLPIGVIGTGDWARSFRAKAQHSPDVNLVACWDPNPEAARRFARTYHCEATPTIEALLEASDIEAVAIFSPNSHHREPTEMAAAAGKHVFVDKPIANTIADAASMIRACHKAGVTLMVGHSTRYHGAYRALRSLLDSGRLGTIAMAEGNMSHSAGARLTESDWRWHRSEAPGGPLIQLSVHMFDTLHYLLGPTRRVTALSTDSFLPSEIEDVFLALLEFDSGVLAYVGTNYLCPPVGYIHIYGTKGHAYSPDEAYFDERKLVVVTVDPYDPWTTRSEEAPVPEVNAYAAEMSEFARAVRTSTPPETGGREGLLSLAVVWAAIMSADQGRPIELKEALGEAASLAT